MTESWTIAAGALLVPLALAVVAAGRGAPALRYAAMVLASSVAVLVAIALSFVLDQPSSIDVALTMALLGLGGTLLFAVFEERWL